LSLEPVLVVVATGTPGSIRPADPLDGMEHLGVQGHAVGLGHVADGLESDGGIDDHALELAPEGDGVLVRQEPDIQLRRGGLGDDVGLGRSRSAPSA
jgi:hypothetical protein